MFIIASHSTKSSCLIPVVCLAGPAVGNAAPSTANDDNATEKPKRKKAKPNPVATRAQIAQAIAQDASLTTLAFLQFKDKLEGCYNAMLEEERSDKKTTLLQQVKAKSGDNPDKDTQALVSQFNESLGLIEREIAALSAMRKDKNELARANHRFEETRLNLEASKFQLREHLDGLKFTAMKTSHVAKRIQARHRYHRSKAMWLLCKYKYWYVVVCCFATLARRCAM